MMNINRKVSATQVVGLFGLALLVGVTWLLGIPMFDDARLVFQYIFAVLNSLQGVFIFIFQVARTKDVKQQWKKLIRRSKPSSTSCQIYSAKVSDIPLSSLTKARSSTGTKTSTVDSPSGSPSEKIKDASLKPPISITVLENCQANEDMVY